MTRKVLGRGLRALIPEPDGSTFTSSPHLAVDAVIGTDGQEGIPGIDPSEGLKSVLSIPIDRIVPNARQPRNTWDDESLDELAKSISQKGLLEPILVRPRGEQFEIIAGERRWRACKAAGLSEIPAILRRMGDAESLEAALIENIQREDLNPVEEARAYQMLTTEYGLTHEEIAQRVAKNRSTVTNLLRLLRLSNPVLEHVSRGTLTVGHARALLSLAEDQRDAAAEKIAAEGWSVREAEIWIASLTATGKTTRGRSARRIQKPDHIRRIEEDLCRHFGTQARIRQGRQGGRIELRFHDDEELSRLLEQFGVIVS
ncbi:MAG: ParB/RepB/Spo0J family partition protein [Candidatus Eisenbacteria bacterium]|nr:ParB/RepB/Spo0J family partition protein [Candidatus Eisenbacteria bacterium]